MYYNYTTLIKKVKCFEICDKVTELSTKKVYNRSTKAKNNSIKLKKDGNNYVKEILYL